MQPAGNHAATPAVQGQPQQWAGGLQQQEPAGVEYELRGVAQSLAGSVSHPGQLLAVLVGARLLVLLTEVEGQTGTAS